MLVFGPRWDAPMYDESPRYPSTPTHARCARCGEQFVEGDQGVIMPWLGSEPDASLVVAEGRIEGGGSALWWIGDHWDCLVVELFGHSVGVCACTDFDIRTREAAREAWRRVEARERHPGRTLRIIRRAGSWAIDEDGHGELAVRPTWQMAYRWRESELRACASRAGDRMTTAGRLHPRGMGGAW